MSGARLDVEWLGRIEYGRALELQEALVEERRDGAGELSDRLLLLEHEPVYTLGRSTDRSAGVPGALPHPTYEIGRGGQATYHGPGQLVGYPIIDLRRRGQDLHRYLRALEELLIELLAGYGIGGGRREGLTGVWVEDRKIASIGVGVRRWVTMHGFALNVENDLAPFGAIVPCGIVGVRMTSVSMEAGRAVGVAEVAARCGEIFAGRLSALLG